MAVHVRRMAGPSLCPSLLETHYRTDKFQVIISFHIGAVSNGTSPIMLRPNQSHVLACTLMKQFFSQLGHTTKTLRTTPISPTGNVWFDKYTNLGKCCHWTGRWEVNFNLQSSNLTIRLYEKISYSPKAASKWQFLLLSNKTTILTLYHHHLQWRTLYIKQFCCHCFLVISIFIPLFCPIQRVRYRL